MFARCDTSSNKELHYAFTVLVMLNAPTPPIIHFTSSMTRLQYVGDIPLSGLMVGIIAIIEFGVGK